MPCKTDVKYTLGPWKVGFDGNLVTTEPDGAGRALGIASLVGINRNDDDLKTANAHLIAAAPDMLEALEFAQFLEELQATHNPQDIIRLLESRGDYESGHLSTEQMIAEYEVKVALAREAAIAKAKGGAA